MFEVYRKEIIWGGRTLTFETGKVARQADGAVMVSYLTSGLFETGSLAGLRVVITAGPTREDIDPVRYISNNSSGKMGYALVEAALEAGAETILISGPVSLNPPDKVAAIQAALLP